MYVCMHVCACMYIRLYTCMYVCIREYDVSMYVCACNGSLAEGAVFYLFCFVFFYHLEQQRDAPLAEGAIFGARPH